MPNTMKQKLRTLRENKGMSLDRLADISDTSKSYLWELENRENVKPSAKKLTKIADALDVTLEYLLHDSSELDSNVTKEAFFRKYSKLSSQDQQKINDILDVWSKK